METESCHSNQNSYLTGTKNNIFVEAGTCMQSISFISQIVSEEIFKDFFQKFALFGAPATNQNKRLGRRSSET